MKISTCLCLYPRGLNSYKKAYPLTIFINKFASLFEKIKKAHLPSLEMDDGAGSSRNPFCVILADDDEDDRKLFEEAVAQVSAEIKVLTANDGFQLMAKLNSAGLVLPEIIFLDLNMGGKTGKECLREIKCNERLRDIPVIIYSTSGSIKDIQDTKLLGATSYIRKPHSFTSLTEIVAKAFSIDWEEQKEDILRRNFLLNTDLF